MEGEREPAARADTTPSDLVAGGLRARLAEMRLEVLRLRASRRTLMALLEMEGRRRATAERECARLRARLRAQRPQVRSAPHQEA